MIGAPIRCSSVPALPDYGVIGEATLAPNSLPMPDAFTTVGQEVYSGKE
jgi:hypothetical protein